MSKNAPKMSKNAPKTSLRKSNRKADIVPMLQPATSENNNTTPLEQSSNLTIKKMKKIRQKITHYLEDIEEALSRKDYLQAHDLNIEVKKLENKLKNTTTSELKEGASKDKNETPSNPKPPKQAKGEGIKSDYRIQVNREATCKTYSKPTSTVTSAVICVANKAGVSTSSITPASLSRIPFGRQPTRQEVSPRSAEPSSRGSGGPEQISANAGSIGERASGGSDMVNTGEQESWQDILEDTSLKTFNAATPPDSIMYDPLYEKLELNNNGFLEPETTERLSSGEDLMPACGESTPQNHKKEVTFNNSDSDGDGEGDFDLNIFSSCEEVRKNWVKISDKEPSDIGIRKTPTTFTLSSKRKLIVDKKTQINIKKEMAETSNRIDLPPPTKGFMSLSKNGDSTKLLTRPGHQNISAPLLKQFSNSPVGMRGSGSEFPGDPEDEDDDVREIREGGSSNDYFEGYEEQYNDGSVMYDEGRAVNQATNSPGGQQLVWLLCPQCGTMCEGVKALKDHMVVCQAGAAGPSQTAYPPANDPVEDPQSCEICSKSFMSHRTLENHMKKEHKINQTPKPHLAKGPRGQPKKTAALEGEGEAWQEQQYPAAYQDDNVEQSIILPDRKLSPSKDPGDIVKSSQNQTTNAPPKYQNGGSTVKLFRPWETPQKFNTRFQDSASGNLEGGSSDIMVNHGTAEMDSGTMVNHKTGDRIVLKNSTGPSATTSRTMSEGRDQISNGVILGRSKPDCVQSEDRAGCVKFLVTNLPRCTEQNLNNLFSPFSKVKEIKINAVLGSVGYVVLENKEGIEEALSAKPILLFGHRLEVSKMKEKNPGHIADGLKERQHETHQTRQINSNMLKKYDMKPPNAKKLPGGHSSSRSRTESGGKDKAHDDNRVTVNEPMESHFVEEESQIEAEEPNTQAKKVKSTKVHKQLSNFECTACSCRFKTVMKLKMHNEIQHVPIPCPVTGCNKMMLRKRMNRHLNTHKQQKIPCPFPDCAVMFNRKDNLKAHIRNVHAN